MVVVPESEAGAADGRSASDEAADSRHDASSLGDVDMDGDTDEFDMARPDAAPDIGGGPPYRDAAFVVPPCPVLPTACDPVQNVLCPSPALTCYVIDSAATVCTCSTGEGNDGALCETYGDCLPGLTCVGDLGDAMTRRCRVTCYVSTPTCPTAGTSCLPIIAGAKLGYCG
jgi:hypothetical protein